MFEYFRRDLVFKSPAGTSRGVLLNKPSWFLQSFQKGELQAVSECSIIPGLSIDEIDRINSSLDRLVHGKWSVSEILEDSSMIEKLPALRFCLENIQKSAEADNPFVLEINAFTRGEIGIPINGLIWMGDRQHMYDQIRAKIEQGFDCIKLKIGAIALDDEIGLLAYIRKHFNSDQIELRLDANGAFDADQALDVLKRLSDYDIHSIEQPIKPRQWPAMKDLCEHSPIPIALDEELIGIPDYDDKSSLLDEVRPQYIILKPSLVGGFGASDEWISLADKFDIGWWATSALESNIGLNAIAQWVSSMDTSLPQGLGTGQLFTNNIDCPLIIKEGHLWYDTHVHWDTSSLLTN